MTERHLSTGTTSTRKASLGATEDWSKGLQISRFFGRVTAIGLIAWLWKINGELQTNYPNFTLFLTIIGVLYAFFLLMPWSKKIPSKIWWGFFLGFIALSVALAIGFVGSVAYEQVEALESLRRARPPILQGILMFLCLLQIPTLFFDRMQRA